jgi:hypothetical protein
MRSPLLILLATSALAFTAACGASEEEVPGIAASPTAAPTRAPASSAALSTSSTTSASPVDVPADWTTFTLDSVPEVIFRYPREWYRTTPGSRSTLTSWDPASWDRSYIPPGGVQVQLDRIRLDDPAIEHRPDAASDVTMAGVPGWQIIYAGTTDKTASRAHVIAVETKGYRYYLIATFGEGADEAPFSLIAASFSFR